MHRYCQKILKTWMPVKTRKALYMSPISPIYAIYKTILHLCLGGFGGGRSPPNTCSINFIYALVNKKNETNNAKAQGFSNIPWLPNTRSIKEGWMSAQTRKTLNMSIARNRGKDLREQRRSTVAGYARSALDIYKTNKCETYLRRDNAEKYSRRDKPSRPGRIRFNRNYPTPPHATPQLN